ncbi:hypothetical protein IMSAG044_01672 [Lactobacillaceae bacterium]|nr:hypothetical protein IMSAG044_01672 [Lactobacillaceae bacterium]
MIRTKKKSTNTVKKLWQQKRLRYICYVVVSFLAIILIFNKPLSNLLVRSYQPIINQTVINHSNQIESKNDYSSVKKLTLGQIAKARANSKNIPIVGQICIPADGINLPIAKGINNTNLAFAAGTFRKDMKMGQGNYALAGHNMSNLGPKILFSPLYYRAKVGQKIYLTNMAKVYVYRITAKQFVSKYRVDLVQNTSEKIITLITCDATGKNRLMVRGKYLKSMQYKNAPEKIQRAFNQKFNY